MGKYITPILSIVVIVLAVALFIRGGEVLTALAVSTTNSSVVTVNLSNVAPTCNAIVSSNGAGCWNGGGKATTDRLAPSVPFNLVGGYYRTLYCNTTCNDENGWQDMKNWTGDIKQTSAAAWTCSADVRQCYHNTSCQNFTAINTTATNVICSYEVWYNAYNTTDSGGATNLWYSRVESGDWAGLKNLQPANTSFNISTLLAVGSFPTAVNFGVVTPGNNFTETNVSLNIYNYGNTLIDLSINGSDMSCTVGSIPVEYICVNLSSTPPQGYYNMSYRVTNSLGGPETGVFRSLDLPASLDTSSPDPGLKQIYFGIGVPLTGVSGGCQGVLWFAAVKS